MNSSDQVRLNAFIDQFAQRGPFTFYRHTSPWINSIKSRKAYAVSEQERAAFILAYQRDTMEVFNKLRRDIVIAVFSFSLSSAYLRFFDHHFELAIFVLHVAVVMGLQFHKAVNIWNAPLRAMAGRVPVDLQDVNAVLDRTPHTPQLRENLLPAAMLGNVAFVAILWLGVISPVKSGRLPFTANPTDQAPAQYYGVLIFMSIFALVGAISTFKIFKMRPVTRAKSNKRGSWL